MVRSELVSDGTQRGSGAGRAPRTVRLSSPDASAAAVHALRAQYAPYLVVIAGEDLGRRVRVEQGLVVGRDPSVGISLRDAGVSWHHARFEDRGDGWAVVDLESTNGVVVNGARVREAMLSPNDKIGLAHTTLRFDVLDPTDRAFDERVEQLLTIDELSGLLQRRAFDEQLAVLLRMAEHAGQSLGLLVMDLDGVKAINDSYGHLFGAYAIAESGKLIGGVLGERGVASRFGGDEFVAALPGASLEEAAAIGEEIRLAIAGHAFVRDGIVLRPGISIGAASYPSSASDPESLFQRADEALYRAKRAGKNRVAT